MRNFITTLVIMTFLSLFVNAQNPVINIEKSDIKGNAFLNKIEINVEPVESFTTELNANNSESPKSEQNLLFDNNQLPLSADSLKYLLRNGDYTWFSVDTRVLKTSAEQKQQILSPESQQAIQLAPEWLEDQLKLKFELLHNVSVQTEKQYAGLIINAPKLQRDEIAFVIANMSIQSLTDSRFVSDKQMIVRNAQFIYEIADSLQYVKLVEKGDANSRDYYTTTSYRIYDPATKDTVWSEIPRDIYYWFVVHPKLDQEGVYVNDNGNDASGQRTYGYSWRDFIWKNPDPVHDYRNVNKTTSKGSVTTIPRFGELIKSARILWDRNKTYFTFNRPLQGSSALDLIGNWCSRALPVDVTLPRAFQPNQIIMKHDGMCNEDAFLVAATCRTALIPIIYLGTWCEDHVFGSVFDKDWNHFEFFRGGLSETGNQYYGITNMLDRGSYGWKNSMVEGFRPDGFPVNFTSYYANTSTINIRTVDKLGNPVDGVKLTLFAAPNAYNNNYTVCGTAFSNRSGTASVRIGEQKKYLVQAYHPKFGWSPTDSTKAFIVNTTSSVANIIYPVNVVFENAQMPDITADKLPAPQKTDYTLKLSISTQDVLTNVNNRDSQRSRFYLWGNQAAGKASVVVCDSINFEKYKFKQTYEAFDIIKSLENDYYLNIPANTKLYVIIGNQMSSAYYLNLKATCGIYDKIASVETNHINEAETIIYPNPFSETLTINEKDRYISIRIYDVLGNLVHSMIYPELSWHPDDIPNGIYTAVIDKGNNIESVKAIYIKK